MRERKHESCVVPIILVLNKDGKWRKGVDCHAMNNIMVKYCYPIPRVDILDKLHGACVFSNIDLKHGYYQIRMKSVMNGKLPLRLNMVYMSG